MRIITDLHLHSKYSRATSSKMNLEEISFWAKKKGLGIVSTGDWTHGIWLRELKSKLVEKNEGIFKLRDEKEEFPFFILSTELSSIYKYKGKTRRVHFLIFAPGFEAIEKIRKELLARGANLFSDGRPMLGIPVKDVTQIVFEADERCMVIPAHIWTPWYSLYGEKSGFDSLEECFGDLSKYITAIETGLSSDPAMNWRIEELNNRQIVSFGDAHSPQNLGREATVFELSEISYENIRKALMVSDGLGSGNVGEFKRTADLQTTSRPKTHPHPHILYTIEFYPEEGKYHYAGHRKCSVVYSPNEAKKKGMTCPVCGKPLTGGVMSRVETLAKDDIETESKTDKYGIRWIHDKEGRRLSYVMLVPLIEIISESLGVGKNTKSVAEVYDSLVINIGPEFKILLETRLEELEKYTEPKIVQGIKKVRSGDIIIEPGHDGVFGKVKIWKDKKAINNDSLSQEVLF